MQPFTRMLWKEYRSLRMLWIGCVLGTFFLWTVISMTVLTAPRFYPAGDSLILVWSLAMWLPAIYVIGCNAALYAGEREERTADWLTHMAVQFRSLLAAKVSWAIASGVAMQLVLGGGALIVQSLITRVTSVPMSSQMESVLLDSPRFGSFALLESFALSWYWSLRLSRPLPAAGAAAVSLIALNGLYGFFTVPGPFFAGVGHALNLSVMILGPWGILRTLLVIGLLAVDVALTRRWLIGRLPERATPWARLRVRSSSRVASLVPEPSTAWRREWQRFRWLEWQSLRPFLILAGIASLVVWAPLLFWRRPGDQHYQLPFLFFWAYLLPLIAGLAAWQGEQSRQQFRFFINRGVSPLGLWLNKFGLWLAGLMLSFIVPAMLVALCLYAVIWWHIPRHSMVFEQFRLLIYQMTQRMPPLDVAIWSGITLFASAFAVTLYFRRAILAIGAAILMHVVLTIWLATATVNLHLPVWIGTAPVAAWLVWCSLRQLPRWSLERTGWRPKAVIAAEWLAFPALFAPVVIAYWVYSVPMPDMTRQNQLELLWFYSDKEAQAVRVQMPDSQGRFQVQELASVDWKPVREQVQRLAAKHTEIRLRMLTDKTLTTTNMYQLFKSQLMVLPDKTVTATNRRQFFESQEFHRLLDADEWRNIESDIRTFRDTLLSRIGMTAETRFYHEMQLASVTEHQHILAMALLFLLADRDLAKGNSADSIQSVRAAVRYVGALYADAPLLSPEAAQRQLHRELQDRLLAWAEHPANSSATIALLLTEIHNSELRWWMTDQLALLADYDELVSWQERALKDVGWRGVLAWPVIHRSRRMRATAVSNRMRFRYHTPITQRNFAAFPPAMPIRDNAFLPLSESDAAWAYRDSSVVIRGGSDFVPSDIPWGLDAEAVTRLWDRETRIRCTCAALAAIAYRREHGRLPRTLYDVLPKYASISLLSDPWTGNLLRIEPDGLPGPLVDGQTQGRLLDAATPFVWSVGPDLAALNPSRNGGVFSFSSSLKIGGYRAQPVRYFTVIPPEEMPADALKPDVPEPKQAQPGTAVPGGFLR